MWYSGAVVSMKILPILCLLLGGCAAQSYTYTPGATLLSGLQDYKGEMQRIGNSVTRWPERQETAGTLKTVALATLGGSREFSRLIDLDLRKREFNITLSEGSVRPERAREMNEELVKIDEEIAALKPVVRAQIAALPASRDSQPRLESAATIGLLTLAIDNFSANGARGFDAPSTRVGEYQVTDLGSFARVRAPDGRNHRCAIYAEPGEGAALRCEPLP